MNICYNCEAEVDRLERVQGYDVCESCADQAALPPHLRGK